MLILIDSIIKSLIVLILAIKMLLIDRLTYCKLLRRVECLLPMQRRSRLILLFLDLSLHLVVAIDQHLSDSLISYHKVVLVLVDKAEKVDEGWQGVYFLQLIKVGVLRRSLISLISVKFKAKLIYDIKCYGKCTT